VLDRGVCDQTTEFLKLFWHRTGIGIVKSLEHRLADVRQIGVVTPNQLDEQGFLGFEMMIKTAGQDPCFVGDLLQRCAQSRSCDDRVRGP
jgi:hypothetical protein